MKKTTNTAKISNRSLRDFIWMSYRYCIGRHTIAAVAHADTIARVIRDNPNALPEDLKAFSAVDIRRCINEAFRWNDAVFIEGCRDMDAFSAVLYKSAECDNPELCRFIADTHTQEVIVDEGVLPKDKFDKDYIDFIVWVKLANLLDESCHKMVTTEYNGKIETFECYPFPLLCDGKYIRVWASINDLCVSTQKWISQDYITKIEDCQYVKQTIRDGRSPISLQHL